MKQRTHRIVVQEKSATRNAIGEEVVAWVERAALWAEERPLRGAQFFAAAQLQNTVDTVFATAYRADLTPDMRVLASGRAFDVISVIDVGGAHRTTELMCRSGVHDGR